MKTSQCEHVERIQRALERGTLDEELRDHARSCVLCAALVRTAAAERLKAFVEGPGPHLDDELLRTYVTAPDRLDKEMRATADRHLRECPDCRRRHKAMEARHQRAKAEPPAPIPAFSWLRVPVPTLPRPVLAAAVAAMSVLLVVGAPTVVTRVRGGVWVWVPPTGSRAVLTVARGHRVWPQEMEAAVAGLRSSRIVRGEGPTRGASRGRSRGGSAAGGTRPLCFATPWYEGFSPGTTSLRFSWSREVDATEGLTLHIARSGEMAEPTTIHIEETDAEWSPPGPGLYIAWIEGVGREMPTTYFRVLTAREQRSVDRAQDRDPFLRGVLCERLGLLAPALKAYEQALDERPGNRRLEDIVRRLGPVGAPRVPATQAPENDAALRGMYMPIR